MDRFSTRLVALSIAAGLLTALSFPLGPPLPVPNGDGWWLAGWVCLAPLMVAAVRARRWLDAAALGLITGLTAYSMILAWIFPFLIRWAKLSLLEAGAVGSLLILYVSLYSVVFSICVNIWSRRWGAAPALLLAPVAWTGLEFARGVLLTGFPWCLLGSSQQPAVAAIQVADLTGVYGVSFMLCAASALLAWAMGGAWRIGTAKGSGGRTVPAILGAVVAAGLSYGAWRQGSLPDERPSLPVALIQANVAQADKWDPEERDRIERDHVAMTREAARRGARFIVWSESSVPISITHHPEYVRRLESLARETGADLLVGTVTYGSNEGAPTPFNSAVLVTPGEGLSGRYDKLHLVPFGEYVPLKDLLFFIQPLVQEASDFQPGGDIRLLAGSVPPVGTLICYEAIFPELTRRYVRAGAALLVNITNDAWYGDTAMPRQHLLQTAVRAVESRRWVLRCANTGISAVVDPTGRISARAGFEREQILESRVAPVSGITVYAAIGDAFAICCVILTCASMMAASHGFHGRS